MGDTGWACPLCNCTRWDYFFYFNEKYKAHHAGRGMWNGKTSLNSSSIGVEFVAYHDKEITTHQYQSARILIAILKERYGLNDSAVLTHSQVAYSKQNQWNKLDHCGRKHCARNFDRIRAGLGYTWPYDPDVKAGRLQADPKLASIFYGRSSKGTLRGIPNVIDQESTILAIAGEKYDSPNTLYKLPDGWVISGNRIENRIGWHHIPAGTKIILY
jgi:N-acetylmuramoyl-L-alanine amidase